jgi:hypothetical protein
MGLPDSSVGHDRTTHTRDHLTKQAWPGKWRWTTCDVQNVTRAAAPPPVGDA